MSLRPENGVNIILTPHCHFQTITILLPIKTLPPLRSMMEPHHPLSSLVKIKTLASGLAFSSLTPILIPDDHYFHRVIHKAPHSLSCLTFPANATSVIHFTSVIHSCSCTPPPSQPRGLHAPLNYLSKHLSLVKILLPATSLAQRFL